MKKLRKLLSLILVFTLVVSTLYVTQSTTVKADGTYMIKVSGTDTYLYGNGGNVAAGSLVSGDARYYWILTMKDDGSYWIKNQSTGGYMAIENQTGKVELLTTVYDVWASCKWYLNVGGETTIQNAWLGTQANINISGSEAVYNSGTTTFTFESTSGNGGGGNTGCFAGNAKIPGTNDNINTIGATMPYTRYDSKQATLGGGAAISESATFEKSNIASQASEQSYVRLPYSGAYAEWTMSTTGNGVTMRFTMPDSSNGYGLNGSVDVYVNGNIVKTVDLSSYYMWQYFDAPNPSANPTGSPSDTPISGATPAFAFDEVHFKLNTSLKVGDKIRIQSSGASGLEYGVDFLEIEETGARIEKPSNAYSITDFGAVANDGASDLNAIQSCVAAAQNAGKEVYFPEGTFHIDQIWYLNASNVKISGAGIWYTNLQFTNANKGSGGIAGSKAYNVEFCNMYINSNLRSRYGQEAVYKCFMDVWSGGSYIHDVWEDHFECGFWFADYNFSDGTDYSDGVVVANCRIRNNFADGLNFCQGTSNATVYNCSIRNTGDDGLAMWNNNYNVKDESYNKFCYNTIDFVWRAGGIAIYGGNGHQVYNNYISDMFMASGIHLNTAFSGYKFDNNSGITFSNNIIVRSGTTSDSWHSDMAAVDITEPGGTVKNVTFNNTYIYDSQHDAMRVTGYPTGVVFNNTQIYGTGKDGKTTSGNDNGAAIKFADLGASPAITLNGFTYAKIAYGGIIYGSRNSCGISGENNLGSGYSYSIPAGAQSSANGGSGGETETTTQAVTEAPTESPTVSDGYTTANANWNDLNYWSVYFASGWAGDPTGSYKSGNSYNDFSVKINNASNAEWGVQMKTQPMTVDASATYKCVVKANSNMASSTTIRFKEEVSATEISKNLVSGENTFELEFKAGDSAQIFFDLGLAPAGLQFDITSFTLEKVQVAETTTQAEVITTQVEITSESQIETSKEVEETSVSGDVNIDPSTLTYTTITCSGNEELYLEYSIYSSSVAGLVPWYGDGGNTLSLQYSSNAGTVKAVYVNGNLAENDVVTETGLGLTKINPTLLPVNAYSIIRIVTETGEFIIVVKTNENTVPETTTEKVTEKPTEEVTEAPTEEVTTETPTEETTTEEITTEEVTTEVQSIVTDKIKVNGFKISYAKKGIRILTSAEPEIYGKEVVSYGNIFGIVMDGYSDDDMWIDSSNPYVKQFASTSAGISDINYSDSDTAVNYVMTMINNGSTAKAYSQKYRVRGYAKLSDGSYVYSEICEYSIFDVASVLYDDVMMSTSEGHEYLYTDILSVVDPDYLKVDYNWGNTVVKPD